MSDTHKPVLPNTDLLDALVPVPKAGTEPFQSETGNLPFTLSDFWRWSTSDLTNNAMRGIIAEFLVARALGVKTDVRAISGTGNLT